MSGRQRFAVTESAMPAIHTAFVYVIIRIAPAN